MSASTVRQRFNTWLLVSVALHSPLLSFLFQYIQYVCRYHFAFILLQLLQLVIRSVLFKVVYWRICHDCPHLCDDSGEQLSY